jgi:hypothetical protein
MFIDLDLYLIYSLHNVYRGVRAIKLAIHLELCIPWRRAHQNRVKTFRKLQLYKTYTTIPAYFPVRTI